MLAQARAGMIPGVMTRSALGALVLLLLTAGVSLAAAAPIVVKQGRTEVRGTEALLAFSVGRAVECRTFGRLLTVHVPKRGETKVQFRTGNGTKVWLYLLHMPTHTTVWCGAAKWFGGH
jgi:hypothetical protein